MACLSGWWGASIVQAARQLRSDGGKYFSSLLAAEKDVTLAQLGQSYVFLQSDGLVNVQAKYDKIDLVLFLVTV